MSLVNVKVFAGNSNIELASKIADKMGLVLGKMRVGKFNDGETSVEIDETVRGNTVFVIQSTCAPVNDNLMELLVITDALRRAAAKRIIAIVPYYSYSRQDRRPGFSRGPITSRLIADMIQSAGIDHIVSVDIHSLQQQGFFTIPFTNVSASVEFIRDIKLIYRKEIEQKNIIVVSPDVGGVARSRQIASQLNGETQLAIVDKRRPKAGESEVMNIIGDVDGKVCVMIDDIIDSGGTLCKAAAALKNHGAIKVVAYVTHPVLSNAAYQTINESQLDELVVTDTIPLLTNKKIRQISISNVVAETLRRIRSKQSVSQIYV
jgi:ribose-phosphate pyrophosphokinase